LPVPAIFAEWPGKATRKTPVVSNLLTSNQTIPTEEEF